MIRYNPALRLFIFDEDETGDLRMTASYGNSGAIGNAFHNNIYGNDDDNIIDGGGGGDYLAGGGGNDTYHVDDYSDVVDEFEDQGFDTIISSIDISRLCSHVEKLILTRGASKGVGNNLNNEIIGNANMVNVLDGREGNDILTGGAKADELIGGQGNDYLDGRGGADKMIGGIGDDTYIIHDGHEIILEAAGEGTDQVNASVSHTLQNNFESLLLLGDAHLSGTGNNADNRLTGNTGRNVLRGYEGNDTLNGGADADRLEGGSGNDTYFVDNKDDRVIENSISNGNDTVYASVSYTLSDFVENLFANGSAAICLTGNKLANTIRGNDKANIINGGAGADKMAGGAGNDTYYVDNIRDVITDTSGTDTVIATSHYTLSNGLENLTAAYSATSLKLTGNASDNAIKGNTSKDTLKGLDGNDTLNGRQNSDILYGGKGKDTFVFDTQLSSSNVDKICDFSSTYDTIYLDNAIFKKLGAGSLTNPTKLNKAFFTIGKEAKDNNHHIIYDKDKGALYYDPDGSGQGKAQLFAQVKAGTIIKLDDLMII
ncbi:calcium-binding protein [Microvirga solisilvae]|uniref:calcium-binding protein n=1 Tax=Microvirga solisilvae TaxID=2919498 RepID=UPI001FAF0045|nr:calcium-binding protein [Microvirga solisilvae]